MNDDDQGFTCETKTEFIQLNYIPISPTPSSHRHSLPNNIKISLSSSLFCSSLINQQIITETATKFLEKHDDGSIIFNNLCKRYVKLQNEIVFESNFQSGNLEYVTEAYPKVYHLYMRADTNTRTHHQWFYFKVKNKELKKITLVIKNFMKSSLLYRRGLKPFVKSFKNEDEYYSQIGSNVSFEEEYDEDDNVLYSLKFQYIFEHLNDQVEFCTEPPYTYTKLCSFIQNLPFKTIQMGKTVMGRKIQALMVNDCKISKAVVVVISRQHPGETVGSWLMEGFLNKLKMTENSDISWLIVPMINIDGVLLGNNRTGLLGYDFNRHWNADQDALRENIFPEITGITKYLKKCRRQKTKRIKLFLDLHGHSSEANVFSYGPPLHKQSEHFQNSRLFPFLMSKRNPNFKLNQCSYNIENEKKYCARSVFYNKLGFPYSYTIQSSFGVYNNKNINEIDMIKVGQDLCQTTEQFLCLLTKEKKEEKFQELISEMKIQNEKYVEYEHYDSDSQEDQKEEICPSEVQKKMSNFLTTNKKNKNCRTKLFNKEKMNSGWNSSVNTNSEPTIKQFKNNTNRIKTEPFYHRSSKLSARREVRLPSLSKQQFAYGNIITRRSAFVTNLKKVGIRQTSSSSSGIFENCTIGKGVIILNGYKKY